MTARFDLSDLAKVLDQVWSWSEGQGLVGFNKHDGLNSPFLRFFLGWAKWPRILAIQAVMRSPINIRPVLGVQKSLNPKGLALFAQGLLDRHRVDSEGPHLQRAQKVFQLLLANRSPGSWSGNCWGYHYPWQDLGFFAPTNTPNAVVTSFVCEAFLQGYKVSGNQAYLEAVGSACDFFLNDLTILLDEPERMCFAYMPLPMSMRVMDVSILIGAVLAQYGALIDDEKKLSFAHRLVGYVVRQQTEYGAWYYTDPPGDSLIGHDNYHTGFIIDALWRYMAASGDWQWKDAYESGLKFYAEKLFNSDGSPRWMSDKDFPHDVHGAAQGMVSFSLAAGNGYLYRELLEKIVQWSLHKLYHPDGRFYYQQGRWWTKTFTLLRWCNAWMFRGVSSSACALGREKEQSIREPRENL